MSGGIVQRHAAYFSSSFLILLPPSCLLQPSLPSVSNFPFFPPLSPRQNIVFVAKRATVHPDVGLFLPFVCYCGSRKAKVAIHHPSCSFWSLHFNHSCTLWFHSHTLTHTVYTDPITGISYVVCYQWKTCCVILVGGLCDLLKAPNHQKALAYIHLITPSMDVMSLDSYSPMCICPVAVFLFISASFIVTALCVSGLFIATVGSLNQIWSQLDYCEIKSV